MHVPDIERLLELVLGTYLIHFHDEGHRKGSGSVSPLS
jgi:hypothetical protein